MTQKVLRRLSKRLQHIYQWSDSSPSYDAIWDLCCDHGRLGIHLHAKHPTAQIYLVDKVESIVDKLSDEYGQLNDGRLHFLCEDASKLSIGNSIESNLEINLDSILENSIESCTQSSINSDRRVLVIIAGVGGLNTIAILDALCSRFDGKSIIEFILSPNAHVFELRRYLAMHRFISLDEAFVSEKGFYHEHLRLRFNNSIQVDDARDSSTNENPGTESHESVSLIGNKIWENMTEDKRRYVGTLLKHYRKMVTHKKSDFYQEAIDAYRQLL